MRLFGIVGLALVVIYFATTQPQLSKETVDTKPAVTESECQCGDSCPTDCGCGCKKPLDLYTTVTFEQDLPKAEDEELFRPKWAANIPDRDEVKKIIKDELRAFEDKVALMVAGNQAQGPDGKVDPDEAIAEVKRREQEEAGGGAKKTAVEEERQHGVNGEWVEHRVPDGFKNVQSKEYQWVWQNEYCNGRVCGRKRVRVPVDVSTKVQKYKTVKTWHAYDDTFKKGDPTPETEVEWEDDGTMYETTWYESSDSMTNNFYSKNMTSNGQPVSMADLQARNDRPGLFGRFFRNRAAVRALNRRPALMPRVRAYYFGD